MFGFYSTQHTKKLKSFLYMGVCIFYYCSHTHTYVYLVYLSWNMLVICRHILTFTYSFDHYGYSP